MRKSISCIVVSSMALSGCNRPEPIPPPVNREFVTVASLLNNIKCELSDLQKNYGKKLVDPYQNIGGILTLSIKNTVTNNQGVTAAIPVYPGLEVDLGASHNYTDNYTSKLQIAIATFHDPKAPDVDCSQAKLSLVTPDQTVIPLDGPLTALIHQAGCGGWRE